MEVLPSDRHPNRASQTAVGGLTRETPEEWRRSGCNLAEKEQNLRVVVSGLIDLTRQNQSLLQATIARTRLQLDQLGEAGKNLKRLRASYGNIPSYGRFALLKIFLIALLAATARCSFKVQVPPCFQCNRLHGLSPRKWRKGCGC